MGAWTFEEFDVKQTHAIQLASARLADGKHKALNLHEPSNNHAAERLFCAIRSLSQLSLVAWALFWLSFNTQEDTDLEHKAHVSVVTIRCKLDLELKSRPSSRHLNHPMQCMPQA